MKSILTCIALMFCDASSSFTKSQKLEQLFSTYEKAGLFSGSVLIAEKGKIIFENSYGYRNALKKKRKIPIIVFTEFSPLQKCSRQLLFFSWKNRKIISE